MLLNIINLACLYTIFYAACTLLGLSFSRIVFSSRTYIASLFSPMFGLAIFCLISTALMNHYTGLIAGRAGLALTIALSIALFVIHRDKTTPLSLKQLIKLQLPGYLAGAIFLLPLFISGDMGLFALNGADFGSYAGWGQYFQNYTLHDALPHTDPINFTQKAFTNLQTEITKPGGHWRIGNISLFAALCSLLPKHWPTLYMTCVAFLMGQFIIAMQLFARITLFQRLKNSMLLGLCAILLNTIFWLACAHYVPNIAGLTLSLLLICIFLLANRFRFRLALGTSVLLGTLLLLYPENIVFIPVLLLLQLLIRDRFYLSPWSGNFWKSRVIISALIFFVSVGLAYLCTFESFFRCIRHLVSILGYDRPGDYVGIDFWSYLSQGIGFIDYNGILRNSDVFWDAGLRPDAHKLLHNNLFWMHSIYIVNYLAALLLLIFGFSLKSNTRQKVLQKKSCLMILLVLLALAVPILQYYFREQYLLSWRSLLTISPYVWLLLCIGGLNAISVFKNPAYKPNQFQHYFAGLTVVSFAILLITAASFRIIMIKNIAFGVTHAAVFGQSQLQSAEYLQSLKENNNSDVSFLDYEGTGTIQAGWEFYLQNVAYVFPQHGSGRNEYALSPLIGKRVAILSDKYAKVFHLKGFPQTVRDFQGRSVLLTDNNNVLQIYSSTWIYNRDVPSLLLPGMPGELLLWLKENSQACLKMAIGQARGEAYLRITFNNNNSITKSITQLNQEKVCGAFNKGLNVIRLEPIYIDSATLQARQKYLAELAAKKKTEDEAGIYGFYTQSFKPVDPFSSPTADNWGKSWNLITPPNIYPLNPYVEFTDIVVEKA